jgi:hypothetical protein
MKTKKYFKWTALAALALAPRFAAAQGRAEEVGPILERLTPVINQP